MKKAVGHLIPFMEKEREEQFAEMGGCSVEETLAVSKWHLSVIFILVFFSIFYGVTKSPA